MNTLIIEAIIVLLLSAFFSGMEIAFVSSNKMLFELERENSSITSKIIDIFYRHPNNFISTLLVGNNIALVVYGIIMAQLISIWILVPLEIHNPTGECVNEGICLTIQTVLSTLLVLFVGEFLPKTLFKMNPNRMISFFALPALIFYIVLWPISKFASILSKSLLRMMGLRMAKRKKDEGFSRVDLDYLIQSNIDNIENEEELEDEVKIFQNALDFSNVRVRDCIVPRTEIVAVSIEASLMEIRQMFVDNGISKLIIYREDIDDIAGFIHSSEMFRLKNGDDWKKCIREVPIVPETMPAQKLLSMFTGQKKSLAVVVDEFGGTSGIVTFEDLVEEIFGEIYDEHDKAGNTAKQLSEKEFQLSARLEIEKVNEMFDLDLPESDDYLTVGGLILHEYQSFPKLNEIVKFGHWEFKIIKNTTTKIEEVILTVKE